jgi:hypothetical protein
MVWAQEFQSHGLAAVAMITIALFIKSNLGGILAVWPFFTRRYDFLKSNFEKTGGHKFSFNVLHVGLRYTSMQDAHLNYTYLFIALCHGSQGHERTQGIL